MGAPQRILVADDDEALRESLAVLLRRQGFEVDVAENGLRAAKKVEETCPDVVIADLRMPLLDGLGLLRRARAAHPDLIVIVITGYAGVDSAVQAMGEGAEDYLTKPVKGDELILVVRRAIERRALRREAAELRIRLKEHVHFDNILGTSPVMQDVFKVIEQVAPSRATVLITGESGTGKELVAQAIHESSPRAGAPFVKLHCAALAETILESELFGHEKGAFTGSGGRREGRFKQADGGTLFLDEIADISHAVQIKLLRFLQERTFERVGGNETLKVDVRVIAATNRDLTAEVSTGHLREDLYYRLNVVNLELPPLRARASDIMPLASHFLHRFAKENGKRIEGFEKAAIHRITTYRWPGNVRQLENVMERAVVLCEGALITTKNLRVTWTSRRTAPCRFRVRRWPRIERHAILTTLDACGDRAIQAARMLNISVRNIQYKLKEYGVGSSGRPPPPKPYT